MKIDWLGHCCFRLTESTGTTILTDPFDPKHLGCEIPALRADAVTCSHTHPNHSYVSHIGGNPVILATAGSYDVKGVHIDSLKTQRAKASENLVFRYRLDGVDVCHLGDIGEPCTPELVDLIGPVDILFLPVGGNGYTIDAETAAEYVEQLMPEVIFPMHYDEDDCDNDYDFDSVKDFLKLFDDENVRIEEREEATPIEYERDDFPMHTQRIILPQRLK